MDGAADVSELKKLYGFIELRVADLPNDEMRAMMLGTPRSKLAAMWEGPFEHFVWMDSDAIAWGNIVPFVNRDLEFQIFWSEISIPQGEKVPPSWLRHYYFDPEKLAKFDPEFEWRGLPYFSDGVFACRRNAIPFERWKGAFEWNQAPENPWPRDFFCMPIMNYLVHSMAQRGELKVDFTDLQHIWLHHGKDEIVRDCAGGGWRLPEAVPRPRVLHFCGRKPYILTRKNFTRPFTMARLEHYRLEYRSRFLAWAKVAQEEIRIAFRKALKRISR